MLLNEIIHLDELTRRGFLKGAAGAAAAAAVGSAKAGAAADDHDKAVGCCMGYMTLKGDYRVMRTFGRSMDPQEARRYENEWKKLLRSDEKKALETGRASCLKFEKNVD
jgi:anaerobic selenocysteine-containing dehydrogenase